MALSSSTVFELRTTGSDNNGGGFVTGASGTDFSQQASAQYALTGLTTVGISATISTTSAAAVMVGNLINITGGTNFTTGIYQIISVVVGTSITVDRNAATAAGLSGTGNIGGALLTPGKLLAQLTVSGMIAWIAAGTYVISIGLTTSSGVNTAIGFIRIQGYNTSRGDLALGTTLTRPVVQLSAAVTALTDANGGFTFENITWDGNAKVASGPSLTGGSYSTLFNSIIKNFAPTSGQGVQMGGSGSCMMYCEVTNISGTVSAVYCNGSGNLYGCYIHDNSAASGNGLLQMNSFNYNVEETIFANNTGANTDAIFNDFDMGSVRRCSFYNNARDGIRNSNGYSSYGEISNNIFYGNGGIGLNMSSMSPARQDPRIHHNAYGNNTGGSYGTILAGVGDVALTSNPFVNSSSGNFAIDDNTGGGLALRQAGWPGNFVGGSGYTDIGALQAQQNILVNPQR